ncbi:alcohol dehydrogenase catalytic domain-containing protein [Brachybacterium alimentarium]|uniref:alcohol dehydrogenase catalytic domain-containing protein n=1 Tax=Brachybacterium alimentarium TaxID=47845 RepID=UPI000DF2B944|nr:alcohol dehydrogenase catalytic domain-containing protein [Brachybacterium alimentarium]RCS66678.1 glutathione-dependent formaldehyde dehydrogenase [Brachybacterium alimentarium]RCS77651.1 glutathione-dependent formaldehyde dehydrogenase [Brachybacterium alimentarium]RCS84685.1 glutathione-dependent formaldehyde dehydrogenase [Brachybacterium alimentarium]
MRAVTWQGTRHVSVEDVPDPTIQQPSDAIIRITSTAICGSDLHLYEVLGPFMTAGDVIGHEPMGIVEAVGAGVSHVRPGDRVVVPFTISCGDCAMCSHGLQSQCETTQVTEYGSGAALLGYSKLYGQVPGGQAEYLRVPHADYGLIKVGTELPDENYLFLSDILPTAWQAVEYADVPTQGTLAVVGLGPVGQLAARIARHRGVEVVGIDPVPERRTMAARHGIEVFDLAEDTVGEIRERTEGRGPDAVVDAVGMEADGSPFAGLAQTVAGKLPDAIARPLMENAGVDRLAALHSAIDLVRRGGTISLSGVYGGAASPMPLLTMFDKQIQLRMGQCNVRSWTDDLLPLVEDPADPLGVGDLVTHRLPLEEAAVGYDLFQKKHDGCIKVVLDPTIAPAPSV